MRNMTDWLYYKELYKWTEIEKHVRNDIVDLFDRHHCNSLHLNWENLDWNIKTLRRPLHNYIHEVLNIPQRELSGKMRDIRIRTNHKLIHNVATQSMYHNLQKQYFSKLYDLPTEAINAHEHAMYDWVNYRSDQANKLTWYNKKQETVENFHIMHETYNDVRLRISHYLESELKKKYYS